MWEAALAALKKKARSKRVLSEARRYSRRLEELVPGLCLQIVAKDTGFQARLATKAHDGHIGLTPWTCNFNRLKGQIEGMLMGMELLAISAQIVCPGGAYPCGLVDLDEKLSVLNLSALTKNLHQIYTKHISPLGGYQ